MLRHAPGLKLPMPPPPLVLSVPPVPDLVSGHLRLCLKVMSYISHDLPSSYPLLSSVNLCLSTSSLPSGLRHAPVTPSLNRHANSDLTSALTVEGTSTGYVLRSGFKSPLYR